MEVIPFLTPHLYVWVRFLLVAREGRVPDNSTQIQVYEVKNKVQIGRGQGLDSQGSDWHPMPWKELVRPCDTLSKEVDNSIIPS